MDDSDGLCLERRESATDGCTPDTIDCCIDRVDPRVDVGRLAREIARAAGDGGTVGRSELGPAVGTFCCTEFGRDCPGLANGEDDSRTRLRCWYAEGACVPSERAVIPTKEAC